MGKKGGKGRREGASGTRDDEVIKVNSSWPTRGVNKLMLRQRKARQALWVFGEISQQEHPGGGAEKHPGGVWSFKPFLRSLVQTWAMWRPLARDYSYSCFNYSANLTAWVGFVHRSSIKCVNT